MRSEEWGVFFGLFFFISLIGGEHHLFYTDLGTEVVWIMEWLELWNVIRSCFKQFDWLSVWSVFLNRSIRRCWSQRRWNAEHCCTDSCRTCHCPPTRCPNTVHTHAKQKSLLQILSSLLVKKRYVHGMIAESSNVCLHSDCAEPPAVAAEVWDVHERELGWRGVLCPCLRGWRLPGIDAL